MNIKPVKVGIIINKPRPAYSETFISNHIQYLNACTLNVNDLTPFPVISGNLFARLIKKAYNALGLIKALWWLRKNRIEVCLAEYGYVGIPAMRLIKRTNLPFVVHFHGADAYAHQFIHTPLLPDLFACAKAIVVVSTDMKAQIIKTGAPADKVHFNVYGVDINLFQSGKPADSPPVLLFVGRFTDKKAPYLLIMSFAKVIQEVTNAKLVMVGNGELFETCKRLVQTLGLEESVSLTGKISQEEVANYMQKARVFVQHSLTPSNGDREGTPNTILEASASGLPVISTKHGGIIDVVEDGKTGFLVEEGDVKGMSEKMVFLLNNPLHAEEMGKAGRYKIEKQFNLPKRMQQLSEIIHHAANRK